ncbi:hypothetical protein GUJ93_ZPchr0006g46448 [Zizania palustris]|uniref:Uncharacterized protein n=1 Tax=Zizania palustris TaxID=103762 RepID=A0A8J5SLN7_ZIZPA|nr:hypothetical protein GUJ93_ZPchr0006g46448 [Zizania palustris]
MPSPQLQKRGRLPPSPAWPLHMPTMPGGAHLAGGGAVDAMQVDPPRASAEEKHGPGIMGGSDAVTASLVT